MSRDLSHFGAGIWIMKRLLKISIWKIVQMLACQPYQDKDDEDLVDELIEEISDYIEGLRDFYESSRSGGHALRFIKGYMTII